MLGGMNAVIRGLGTAVPPKSIAQGVAAEHAAERCLLNEQRGAGEKGRRRLAALYRRAGIRTRHVAALDVENGAPLYPPRRDRLDRGPTTGERMDHYDALAFPLALEASREALVAAATSPPEITHLVTASCTGFRAPGVDLRLMEELPLLPSTRRVHVGFMGCHGVLNGLMVAKALCESTQEARVLLTSVELCSLHFQYAENSDALVANSLFSDGAGACVLGGGPCRGAWEVVATASQRIPESEGEMTWTIGDHGYEMTLSARVPELIGLHLRPWLEAWLRDNDLRLDEVSSWAVHPGGPRVLDCVEKSLGLGIDSLAASRSVLSKCGNMSSATVFFVLRELAATELPLPCVVLAFGPGLVIEAALLGRTG
jgi:predicted naringenin-chalcone synthase